jgi:hypothetical protein
MMPNTGEIGVVILVVIITILVMVLLAAAFNALCLWILLILVNRLRLIRVKDLSFKKSFKVSLLYISVSSLLIILVGLVFMLSAMGSLENFQSFDSMMLIFLAEGIISLFIYAFYVWILKKKYKLAWIPSLAIAFLTQLVSLALFVLIGLIIFIVLVPFNFF